MSLRKLFEGSLAYPDDQFRVEAVSLKMPDGLVE